MFSYLILYWELIASFGVGLCLAWPVAFYHHKKRYREITLFDMAMRRPQELTRLSREIDNILARHAKESKRQRRQRRR